MLLNVNNAEFVKSAANTNQIISSSLPAIAFAGKSNVGKSSVINCLLNRKNFARTSGEPGKTIHINYFLIDKRVHFVDLPGYGFAKVSQSEKDRWSALIDSFFSAPDSYCLGVLVVDSRHKPVQDDITMADYFSNCGKPFVVVANKTDKLKKSELEQNMMLIKETLKLTASVPLIPFSALKANGRDRLLAEIIKTL